MVAERFWARFDRSSSCWEWSGCRNKAGYGQITIRGVQRSVHRVAWELANGPIQAGAHVLHRCDNRGCANPEHLFLGTHQQNMADMMDKGRRNAPRGANHGMAKLSLDDVLNIRTVHAFGATLTDLAKAYGVSLAETSMICSGKHWAHEPAGLRT